MFSSASYLDLYLEITSEDKRYDKRDDFKFPIGNLSIYM
jgi:hypothetical protein